MKFASSTGKGSKMQRMMELLDPGWDGTELGLGSDQNGADITEFTQTWRYLEIFGAQNLEFQ